MPEIVAALLVLATAGSALLCATSRGRSQWRETSGRVSHGEVVASRDRARPADAKVRVNYEYQVEGVDYRGEYKGFWPGAGSPNALPLDELERLTKEGHSLRVRYRAEDPGSSQLHFSGRSRSVAMLIFASFVGMVCLAYLLLVYPKWRVARG